MCQERVTVTIEADESDAVSLLDEAAGLEAAAGALRQLANESLSKALLAPTAELNEAHAMDYQSGIELGDRLRDRLSDLFDGYAGACALRDMARGAGVGEAQTAPALARVRKPIENAGRGEIRAVYRLLWNQGRNAGLGHHANRIPLRDDEKEQLTRLYRDEQQLFVNALHDVEEGTAKMALGKRATLYGKAAMEAYWMGFVLSDLSSNRYVMWRTSPSEHCRSCLDLEKGGRWSNGVYRAQELAHRGIVPRCRHLLCYAGCNCRLTICARPEGTGNGVPLARMTFGGDTLHPAHAVFSDNGRTGREKLAARVGKLKWNWGGRK